MTKHTPAPWAVFGDDFPEFYPGIEGSDGTIIVQFHDSYSDRDGGVRGKTREEQAANARLIAAAPEMLDALHKAFRALCELVPTNPAFATEVAIVKDAIAKAEGR